MTGKGLAGITLLIGALWLSWVAWPGGAIVVAGLAVWLWRRS